AQWRPVRTIPFSNGLRRNSTDNGEAACYEQVGTTAIVEGSQGINLAADSRLGAHSGKPTERGQPARRARRAQAKVQRIDPDGAGSSRLRDSTRGLEVRATGSSGRDLERLSLDGNRRCQAVMSCVVAGRLPSSAARDHGSFGRLAGLVEDHA